MKYNDIEWLKEMVNHHETAIEMSNLAISKSQNNNVLDLANGIIEAQSKEITIMNDLISEIESKNKKNKLLKKIKAIEFPDRDFNSKEELFKALKANKKTLIATKKATEKRADAVSYGYIETVSKNAVNKSPDNMPSTDLNTLNVKVVINTTNFLDSHGDVHVNGIWSKSVNDNANKGFLHLQEHERDFDKVISDNAKGYVQSMTWKQLGLPYDGKTEALIFESTIEKKRNEFMLNQYANGWVKNHSVGMRYVQLELAVNTEAEYDKEYKAVWDEFYPIIANKEAADERGYFWVVKEAKIIEGSAVVMGSNSATPTIETTTEPAKATQEIEAEQSLQTEQQLKSLIEKFN